MDLILLFVLGLDGFLGVSLGVSYFRPDSRIWPPPGRDTWQFWSVWIAIVLLAGGIVRLGFRYGHPVQRIVQPVGWFGLVLITSGLILALAGIVRLGVHASTGLKGDLVTGGIYQYTRNPQYLGDVMILLGWSLIAGSWAVWITATMAAGWFVLAPVVEEPWLEERFGDEYRRYCEQVPRFL